VGEKESAAGSVSVRDRAAGDLGAEPVAAFVARAQAEIGEKRLRPKIAPEAGGGPGEAR